MFKDELSQFIALSPVAEQPELIVDTKNSYEFNMAALKIGGKWYVLVENPDTSRAEDIDEVIRDEYDSEVAGWCVRKAYQEISGAVLPFQEGKRNISLVTYESCWLLAIIPNRSSRLRSIY